MFWNTIGSTTSMIRHKKMQNSLSSAKKRTPSEGGRRRQCWWGQPGLASPHSLGSFHNNNNGGFKMEDDHTLDWMWTRTWSGFDIHSWHIKGMPLQNPHDNNYTAHKTCFSHCHMIRSYCLAFHLGFILEQERISISYLLHLKFLSNTLAKIFVWQLKLVTSLAPVNLPFCASLALTLKWK